MQAIFKNFGIYVHVPFCAQNCDYCRFYKRAPNSGDFRLYVETIASELKLHSDENGGKLPQADTLFWGGGTPSVLPEKYLETLCEIFSRELRPLREWTVEVAPTSASSSKLKILKQWGVTRISMGVQSFNQKTLSALGRKHTLKATMEAIERVAETGFKNFSIDLIFGAESQSMDEWLDDILKAAALPVDHISAYCLEFDSATSCCGGNSPEAESAKRGKEADFFEAAMDTLPQLGFQQYEISNYARAPEARCLHNLSTWNMAQWLGVGAAAASQWRGLRRRNTPNFEKWALGIKNLAPAYEDVVFLDDGEMFSSALIFGLRMCDGVDINSLKARFPRADWQKYAEPIRLLREEGLIETGEKPSIIKLTRAGKLLADSVAVELL